MLNVAVTWLTKHESGVYVQTTQAGADLFAEDGSHMQPTNQADT
jgi:hypothetical protein